MKARAKATLRWRTAYHFLQADMRAGEGKEPPWEVGETRSFSGSVSLCRAGYHSSPSLWDALQYAPRGQLRVWLVCHRRWSATKINRFHSPANC